MGPFTWGLVSLYCLGLLWGMFNPENPTARTAHNFSLGGLVGMACAIVLLRLLGADLQ